ncbi:serine hydrolase [Sphingomonas sp. SUN039]|uniref:serine hydrolase domain-containing protein n=1 Tax=Sphingomonas sp. SUN039 TaxID=2937787 RepID=UPI002164D351|nr:serine hydrolase domain-containing protein [Sphingomonas sp. SUN039]UVO54188.1 beta-lactamase family protein [Sphingomonas sp. SUN039]
MSSNRYVRGAALAAIAGMGITFAAFGHASVPGAAEAWRTWGQSATAYIPASIDTRFRGRVDYRDFDGRVAGVMADPSMVGLSVAVIEDGRISFAKGYGTTQAVGGTPVDSHTVFRWASLSKGVAATMVGELAAEGKVSLDAPVSAYATTLRLPMGGETRATVDDLLSHRLGIVRNAFDNKLEAGMDPRVLRPQLVGAKFQCAPGACHTYQNVAFDAASEIVQNLTGKTYQSAVQQRLFQPLGMVDASVSRAGLVASRSWAKPHVGLRRTVTVNDNYYRVPAAGGVNSSILDLARWMQAQMGAAPEVVPNRVLDVIHAPRIYTDRHRGMFNQAMGASQYALGWRDYNYLGHRLIGHQGAVMGYRATVLFDPVKRSGIAMLWNSQSGKPVALQLELLDRLYGLPRRDWLGLDKAQTVSPLAQTVTTPLED